MIHLSDIARRLDLPKISDARKRARESGAVDFVSGDVAEGFSKLAEKRLIEFMKLGKMKYPPTEGLPEFKSAVAQHFKDFYCADVDPENVIPVNGGMQGLSVTFPSLLNSRRHPLCPSDSFLIPTPFWGPAEQVAIVSGAEAVSSRLTDDFQLDLNHIADKVNSPNVRGIYVNTPNAPTGSVFARGDLEELVRIADRYGKPIVSDEPYGAFVYGGKPESMASIPEMLENGAVVFSMSKAFAITGARLGAVITKDKNLMESLRKFVSYQTYGVPTMTQMLGVGALEDVDFVRDRVKLYRKKRDIVVGAFEEAGLNVVSSGAYYIFPDLKHIGKDSEEIYNTLVQRGIGALHGNFFGEGYDTHMRFSWSDLSVEQLLGARDKLVSAVRRDYISI